MQNAWKASCFGRVPGIKASDMRAERERKGRWRWLGCTAGIS